MNKHYYCIIMGGGVGSRFWPISREKRPKQFLEWPNLPNSFIRSAYNRFSSFFPSENIFVVSLEKYKDQVLKQIPELSEENLLLEPYSRNTAPSLAFAAYSILKKDPEAVMVAAPADHAISDLELFRRSITKALDYAAEQASIITIGIIPNRPDTNFGYIQALGGNVMSNVDVPLKVKTFTEKPDKELAEVFLQSGEFFWNSGIFVFQAAALAHELDVCAPQITQWFKGWEEHLGTESEKEFLHRVYMDCEKISIDYAVMEKTDNAWVFPSRFGWHDIGNWESLYSFMEGKDAQGNLLFADKSILHEDSNNVIISKHKGKLVAVKGLDNYLVVDTEDVLLICPRDEKDIKDVIAHIAMPEYEDYR